MVPHKEMIVLMSINKAITCLLVSGLEFPVGKTVCENSCLPRRVFAESMQDHSLLLVMYLLLYCVCALNSSVIVPITLV